MTARYLLTITDESARLLESWLGGKLLVVPAVPDGLLGEVLAPFMGDTEPVEVAGLDAITDEEYEFISRRLRSSGPFYHAVGPA